MGVDFLVCKNCGDTFCDCGEYVSCECGEHWCGDECAEADGCDKEKCNQGYEVYDGYEQNDECEKGNQDGCRHCNDYMTGGCNFCREEDFEDYVLLDFALELLNKTRQQLVEEYKASK
jgi:hypothetical protein